MSKRGYHHGNLRQALVEATLSLIEEKGPQGFTLSEAAKAADVTPAAVYRTVNNPYVDAYLRRQRRSLYPGGLFGKGTRHHVGRSSGREANDDAHGLVGPSGGLCPGTGRCQAQQRSDGQAVGKFQCGHAWPAFILS